MASYSTKKPLRVQLSGYQAIPIFPPRVQSSLRTCRSCLVRVLLRWTLLSFCPGKAGTSNVAGSMVLVVMVGEASATADASAFAQTPQVLQMGSNRLSPVSYHQRSLQTDAAFLVLKSRMDSSEPQNRHLVVGKSCQIPVHRLFVDPSSPY